MNKKILTAAIACGAFAMVGTTASAQTDDKSYGYWAGRICDATSSWLGDHAGLPYWQAFTAANYRSRGHCVKEHIEWLKAGNSVPGWAS